MEMEDQLDHTEGMDRDVEAEVVPFYKQQKSRYGRAIRPTTRMVETESRPGKNKIEH